VRQTRITGLNRQFKKELKINLFQKQVSVKNELSRI